MKPLVVMAGMLILASVAPASPPAIPDTPAVVDDVLYARSFTLEKGFKHIWCKERPQSTTGTILVLKVEKALAVPRAIAMPVLYVGDQVAERVNHGHQCGHLIAIVPGEIDLTKDLIWFGTPGLPHQIDAATVKSERALAEKAGIKPFAEKKATAALAKGGSAIRTIDKKALLRDEVAELILEFCPDEKNLADDFRVPVIQRLPEKEEN